MLIRTWGFAAVLFLLLFQSVHAVQYIEGMPNKAPGSIFADAQSRFYLDYGGSMLVYTKPDNQRVIHFNRKYGRMTVNSRHSSVTADGTVISFATASYSEYQKKIVDGKEKSVLVVIETGSFLEFCQQQCKSQRMNGSLEGKAYNRDAKDNLYYAIKHNKKLKYYINTRSVSARQYRNSARSAFPARMYRRAGMLDDQIVVDYQQNGKKIQHKSRFRGRYTLLWDKQGNPHAFFHDPETRSLRYQQVHLNSSEFLDSYVDADESGIENIAFVDGQNIWVIHYFYRTPFSKGLLASQLDNRGTVLKQFVLDASHDRNTGWDLRGNRAPDGRILLTYLIDQDNNKRIYLLLNSSRELVQLGDNLAAYGHIDGINGLTGLSVIEKQELGQELANGFREEVKSYGLALGVGAQYAFWHYVADDEFEYDIDNAIVNLVEFQGKLFNIDYGVEYAQEVVTANASAGGSDVIEYFGAYVGWEKLLYNFDFKINLEQSTTNVRLTDTRDSSFLDYEMDYVGFKFTLLTQKRSQFGLVYQNYNEFRNIKRHRWNLFNWSQVNEGVGEVDTSIFALHYGYTTISYLEKYGVSENRSYFDFEARLGVATHSYIGDSTTQWGGESPSIDSSILIGTQLETGWVWFRRWKSLGGIGGYIKAGYRINIDLVDAETHDPDEDGGTDVNTRFFIESSTMIRHGPLFMVAFTF